MGGGGAETVVLVELASTIIQRVNEQRAHARVLRYLDAATQGILKQSPAQLDSPEP